MASAREKVVTLVNQLNVFLLGAVGLSLIFAVDAVVPGLCEAGKGVARNYGGFALVYSMLINSLGPFHHGGYCLTMVLHFVLFAVNAFQLKDGLAGAGPVDPRLAGQTGFHLAMFAVMFVILTNGGIGGHHKSAAAKKE